MERHNATRERVKIGQVVMQIARVCGRNEVAVPTEVTLIGKALVHLDQLASVLAPQFNPRRSVKRRLSRLLRQSLLKSVTPTAAADLLFEAKRFVQGAPHRINQILDTLGRYDRGFKIDAIDEDRLISGFEKIANRITYGLVVASLYIGGAMVMNIEASGPELGGMPVLAILMLLTAAVGTVIILMGTWLNR
jgi:predicted unusual protein kinase regulating ubiquinone biosynthesis (AarF/ABC1/UbiB family)